MTCQDIAQVTGQHLLFLGTSTSTWNLAQFQESAKFAKAHGIDTLLLKVADGGDWWYGGLAGYRQRRDAIKAEGVGVIPYMYSYGNTFGALDNEINILLALMTEPEHVMCADMETEWNGQVGWATHLGSRMQGQAGTFLVSTWADPVQQNWEGVLNALNPCVDAYMPQQYNNFLASCWQQFAGAKCLQPTLDMNQDFGTNDPVTIAKAAHDQGHTALSVWYYETAVANPTLLDKILAAFPKTIQQQEEEIMIDLTNGIVASHFEGNDTIWTCKDNGLVIGHAILKFYRLFGGSALCGLTYLGLPKSNEIAVPGRPGVVEQKLERGTVRYDPAHVMDNPPGSGDVYLVHAEQDPRYTALQDEIVALKNLSGITTLQQISLLAGQIAKLSQVQ